MYCKSCLFENNSRSG